MMVMSRTLRELCGSEAGSIRLVASRLNEFGNRSSAIHLLKLATGKMNRLHTVFSPRLMSQMGAISDA